MAYNYPNNSQSYYNQPNMQQMQFQQQQNVQPLFPQPQGNVYYINSTLEVANVPTSAGVSVALCMQEGFMYIKTMQNGNPMFWAYKITPYENTNQKEVTKTPETPQINFNEQFEQYNNRFLKLEEQVNGIQAVINQNNQAAPVQQTNATPNSKGGDWQL
jgi:hypothetical protein